MATDGGSTCCGESCRAGARVNVAAVPSLHVVGIPAGYLRARSCGWGGTGGEPPHDPAPLREGRPRHGAAAAATAITVRAGRGGNRDNWRRQTRAPVTRRGSGCAHGALGRARVAAQRIGAIVFAEMGCMASLPRTPMVGVVVRKTGRGGCHQVTFVVQAQTTRARADRGRV